MINKIIYNNKNKNTTNTKIYDVIKIWYNLLFQRAQHFVFWPKFQVC